MAGSPPPMRGIPSPALRPAALAGLTPAHAGNTLEETAETSQQTVKNFSLHTLQHFSVI